MHRKVSHHLVYDQDPPSPPCGQYGPLESNQQLPDYSDFYVMGSMDPQHEVYICHIKTRKGLWAGLLNGRHVAMYTSKLAAVGGFACVLATPEDMHAFKHVCTLMNPHGSGFSFGNLQPLLVEEFTINRDLSIHFATLEPFTDAAAAAAAAAAATPLSPGQDLDEDDLLDIPESAPASPLEQQSDASSSSSSGHLARRPVHTLSRRQARRDREGALGESDAEDDDDFGLSGDDADEDDDDDDAESDSLPIGFDDDHLFKGKRLPRHLVRQARKKQSHSTNKKKIIVDEPDDYDQQSTEHRRHLMFHYTPALDFDTHHKVDDIDADDALTPSRESLGVCLVQSTAPTQTTA